MSAQPTLLEARIRAQERRQFDLEIYIEELAGNMTNDIKQLSDNVIASFSQLAAYQVQTEKQIDTHFEKVENRLGQIDTHFEKVENRLGQIDTHFEKVENRLGQIDTHFEKVESHLDRMETLLTQIVGRLPNNS